MQIISEMALVTCRVQKMRYNSRHYLISFNWQKGENMGRVEDYLSKAEEKHNKAVDFQRNANQLFTEENDYRNLYRIESVNRVLDFIRTEYSQGRLCDLDTLLCHCQNKLYGNIDGVELSLYENHKGVRFTKERDSVE